MMGRFGVLKLMWVVFVSGTGYSKCQWIDMRKPAPGIIIYGERDRLYLPQSMMMSQSCLVDKSSRSPAIEWNYESLYNTDCITDYVIPYHMCMGNWTVFRWMAMETLMWIIMELCHCLSWNGMISSRSLTNAPRAIAKANKAKASKLVCRKIILSGKTKRIEDAKSAYQVARQPQTET